MMLKPQEEANLRALNERLDTEIRLRYHLTDDPRSSEIKNFCRELTKTAPKIVAVAEEYDPEGRPLIRIAERMRYVGVPSGREFDPFLEALAMVAGEPPPVAVDPSLLESLETVRPPAQIRVYVAPFCGFCPTIVRNLLPLPFLTANVLLTVVDAGTFEDLANADQVKSVPAVILDGQYRWTGQFPLQELVDAAVARDPGRLERSTLERMVVEGGASDLAEMMREQKVIFSALYDLIASENFTVRLAAMVTMEELAERDAELARQAVEPLWERFKKATDTIRGDILYVLGEVGSPPALQRLQAVKSGDYSAEVKEAAVEALEKIGERGT